MSERDEIDDPGRDPKGLNPPRNLFGGGPVQDSGGAEPGADARDDTRDDDSAEPEPEAGDDDS
ncbi:MAG: hypothetical protein ACXVX8_14995 [Blastococcus sp.]